MKDTKVKLQKIIKVGNSYAVTLDKKYLEEMGFKVSEPLVAKYYGSQGLVSLSKQVENKDKLSKTDKKKQLTKQFSKEFLDWVDKTIEEDREALEALAKL